MTKLTLLLGLVMRFASVCCKESATMKIIEKWQHIDYDFPSVHDRHFAIGSGLYAPGNVTPIDVDVDYRGPIGLLGSPRIFVTTPRFTTGIPVTLGYVVESKIGSLIHPYPDYSWHSTHGHNCSGITSAFRVAIDACNYLWVLDSGVIGNDQKCPPQLLVFDLFVDTLIHRYKFPKSQYKSSSLFIAHILDTNDPPPFGSCADTKVYIADATAYGLIVYDNLTNKSWRIENRLFYPDPNFSTISVAGESFELMDGIFNFALSPRKNLGFPLSYEKQDNRFLFFHALASGTENSVPLRIINDPSIWEIDENALSRTFRVIGSRSIQTPAEAMDSSGNLFFVLVNPMALVCWDSSTPYTIDNIKVIYRNDETLQFASGVKIVRNAMGMEELWVITNRFQRVYTGKMDLSEVNFRIQTNTVAEMLKGSSSCNADKPIF